MSAITFTPVDLAQIPEITRANSKASLVLAAFQEATDAEGTPLASAQIDIPEGAKMETVSGGLTSYVRKHKLPVQVFTRGGGLYLKRLAADEAAEYWSRTRASRATTINAEAVIETAVAADPIALEGDVAVEGRRGRRGE